MVRRGPRGHKSAGATEIRIADPDAGPPAGIHPDDRVALLLDDLRVETARLADAGEREAEAVEQIAEAVERLAEALEAEAETPATDGGATDGEIDDGEVRRGRTGDGVVRLGGTLRATARASARPTVATASEAEGA